VERESGGGERDLEETEEGGGAAEEEVPSARWMGGREIRGRRRRGCSVAWVAGVRLRGIGGRTGGGGDVGEVGDAWRWRHCVSDSQGVDEIVVLMETQGWSQSFVVKGNGKDVGDDAMRLQLYVPMPCS